MTGNGAPAARVLPRRRSWNAAFLLTVAVLSWGTSLYILRLHRLIGPARQPINIRWTPDTSDRARQAAEATLHLQGGESLEPGTWVYHLQDHSQEALRQIVTHPLVADTAHINRQAFRIVIDAPNHPRWLRRVLQLDLGPAIALAAALFGVAAFWCACGYHRLSARAHLERLRGLSPWLPHACLAGGLQFAIALWVPIGLTLNHDYLTVNLVEHVQPRALVGTVSQYLDLSDVQFLFATQAALFVWLFLVAVLIATPRGQRVPDAPNWRTFGVLFLFGWSTLPFVTNAFSGFVDVFAAATVAVSVWLLYQRDESSTAALSGVVTLMCVATLIHEKSIFDVLILLMWIGFTRPRKQAAWTVGAYALFLAGYLMLSSDARAANGNKTFAEYLSLAVEFRSYLEHYSFNVVGVAFGGGLLWALYAACATAFVRTRQATSPLFPRVALVFGLLALCVAPLLVAWDTSRLVALIWLPTLLLLLELDGRVLLARSRFAPAACLSACLLQVLIPPVLIYRHGAVPLNCYASFVVGQLERVQDADAWPLNRDFAPVTLNLRHDPWPSDGSHLYGCAPIHLTRP